MPVRAKPAVLAGGFLSVFLMIQAAAAATHLAPPFDVAAIRAKVGKKDLKPFACKMPPAPLRDIQVESFYDKKEGSASVVDPAAYKAYKAASKPFSVFEVNLAAMANRYVRANPPRADIAACDLDWLAGWAEAGALLGDVNKNGEYTRKWLLGSLASVWLQIRDEPALDPRKAKIITDWLRRVADVVRADFSRDTDLKSRRNNHLYWAAWSLTAAGLALDDRGFFDWGVEKARQGIDDIRADGTLELEMARGQRAFLYHIFAAQPLFMVANAAERNGIDLFRENDDALHRLGALNLRNLDQPAFFEERTGKKQDLTRVGTSSDLGWVEIYRQHYDDPLADAALAKHRPLKHSRFGGNVTLLYSQLLVKTAGK